MRIGYMLFAPTGGYDPPMPAPQDVAGIMDSLIEEGLAAERAGFHSLQVGEQHGRTECLFPGPFELLTVLARETERVAPGTYSLVATLHHPLASAEQLSVIDNLSRGRLYTTIGRGFHEGYWKQFGIPRERLPGRFQEFIQVWQLAFAGERFDFAGCHYTVEDGLLSPAPYQRIILPSRWPVAGRRP